MSYILPIEVNTIVCLCDVAWFPAFFFFFSSRRRHTRFDCDWSSDVCSSDLVQFQFSSIAIVRFSKPKDPMHCPEQDRKSTRLNSSHSQISYAVFCLKKKDHPARARATRQLALVSRNSIDNRRFATHLRDDPS